MPQCLELLAHPPSMANLRSFEKDLEDASLAAKALRSPMQYMEFALLRDAGDKALVGHDGWLFYKPGVQYLTESARTYASVFQAGPVANRDASESRGEPLAAIVAFRDKLAARGIHLLVVPAPGKASVYPEKLTARARQLDGPVNPGTLELLSELTNAGVEVVDLFALFQDARRNDTHPLLYLGQDTHWSPEGMQLAAHAVADRLLEKGWVGPGNAGYVLEPAPLQRNGDILRMMNAPRIEASYHPEEVNCSRVLDRDAKVPFASEDDAEILVLGDSFLRIYETDEPGAAGFIAHLAHALQMPLASIVNDGGASTLVRQQLYRKPQLLAGKKVVIWEFVERDIRFGTEGWQDVPLPKAS